MEEEEEEEGEEGMEGEEEKESSFQHSRDTATDLLVVPLTQGRKDAHRCHAWQGPPAVPAFRRLRQTDAEFQASHSPTASFCTAVESTSLTLGLGSCQFDNRQCNILPLCDTAPEISRGGAGFLLAHGSGGLVHGCQTHCCGLG